MISRLTPMLVLLVLFGASATPPNIVLIISDDHAWTDYGFMGHASVKTPHLDRLSEQSLTFPRGYVPSSLCCPSLASIITGLYPHQHKVTSNDPPNPKKLRPVEFYKSDTYKLGRDRMTAHLNIVPTLPRLLSSQGYLSLQTGKWWQGHYKHGGFTHGMTLGQRHGDEGLDIGRSTMQPIRDFVDLAQKEGKPFLVWYAPMMPHTPHNPPQRLLAHYLTPERPKPVANYWAMVEWFDETVGELLHNLEVRGAATNTMVIYVTDNGWIQDPESPRFMPKSKQSPYDGGLRTPIMIRWPGRTKPAMEQDLAMSIDIFPTIVSAVGLQRPPGLPGIDLLDSQARRKRDSIYGECFTHDAVDLDRPAANLRHRWMIQKNWKLIIPAKPELNSVPELFRLDRDPHETQNLANENPRLVRNLQKRMDSWWSGQE